MASENSVLSIKQLWYPEWLDAHRFLFGFYRFSVMLSTRLGWACLVNFGTPRLSQAPFYVQAAYLLLVLLVWPLLSEIIYSLSSCWGSLLDPLLSVFDPVRPIAHFLSFSATKEFHQASITLRTTNAVLRWILQRVEVVSGSIAAGESKSDER